MFNRTYFLRTEKSQGREKVAATGEAGRITALVESFFLTAWRLTQQKLLQSGLQPRKQRGKA